jgi:hypothetical protein
LQDRTLPTIIHMPKKTKRHKQENETFIDKVKRKNKALKT